MYQQIMNYLSLCINKSSSAFILGILRLYSCFTYPLSSRWIPIIHNAVFLLHVPFELAINVTLREDQVTSNCKCTKDKCQNECSKKQFEVFPCLFFPLNFLLREFLKLNFSILLHGTSGFSILLNITLLHYGYALNFNWH